MKSPTQQYLESLYLEYVNEYLTVDKMAEHNSVSVECMKAMIAEGKAVHEGTHVVY